MNFSLGFFTVAVFGAIALALIAAVFLPVLFVRDARKKRLW
ncbi:MAG TPA: hypothetical protein VKA86_16605 [Candidatus Krumholzibacteria bacterium]|jgi:hypothetical protein|nr:hypothetical protein [Candidatus Krumholzibacteria bacterium]